MADLVVRPAIVEFEDPAPGAASSQLVTLKNPTTRNKVVRLRPPKGKLFTFRGIEQAKTIAPGLEVTFEVIFNGALMEPGRDFAQDRILLQTEGGDRELVVRATQPSGGLTIAGDLAFGVVPTDSRASKRLTLSNPGKAGTKFRIDYDRSINASFSPSEGSIPAGGSTEVTCSLTVGDAGAVGGEVTVFLDGTAETRKLLLSATAVKQSFEIVESSGVLLKEIDFGTRYFGEMLERSIFIYNNSPVEARYMIAYGTASEMKTRAEAQSGEGGDPDDPYAGFIMAARQKIRAKATNDNPYTITPLIGSLAPFSKAEIKVAFSPEQMPTNKGFLTGQSPSDETMRVFDYVIQVEFGGQTGQLLQRVQMPVRGKGMAGGLRFNPMALEFGDVRANTWADQLVMVTNSNSSLPVKFSFPKSSPYFEVQPSSGTVLGGQDCQLLVRYMPKAMGKHSAQLTARITNQGGARVQEVTLMVSGSSLRAGEKATLVGGTDKLPKDFEKPKAFVDDEQIVASKVAARAKGSRAGQRTWEKPGVAEAFDDIGVQGNDMALAKKDYVARAAHKEAATTARRAQATIRKGTTKRVDENDVNLGMDTRSGLAPFEPTLPRDVDPLWSIGAADEGKPRAQRTVSDRELEGIPWCKDRPETDAERAQCNRELTKDEIGRLLVGPKVVDFGTVAVGSTSTQHLMFANSLDTAVHVVLDTGSNNDLRRSAHASQVVPPHGKAKFPIVLNANEVRHITDKVDYSINSSHVLSFQVQANVVPVSVDLSSEDMAFEFSLDNWEPYVQKVLMLDNPHKFSVDFNVSCTNTAFSVTPSSGHIRSSSSAELMVRWTPPMDGSVTGPQDGYLVLGLVGGSPKRVYLQGQLPEGALRIRDKTIEAGPVPCGVPQTARMQIKNAGTRDSAFRILPNNLVHVTPEREKVAPDEACELEVSFCCNQPGPLTTTIEVQVQGNKTLKVPFKAEGVLPAVELKEDEFDFGAVYIGNTERLPFTLVNTTPVPALVAIDLREHPELQLSIAKEAWSPEEYEHCPLQQVDASGRQAFGAISRRFSLQGRGSARSSLSGGFQHGGGMAGQQGSKYHISLNPSATVALTLAYRPATVRKSAVELCGQVMGTGPQEGASPEGLRRVVAVEGVQPRLVLSSSNINFGTRHVIRSNQIKPPYQMDMVVTRASGDDDSAPFEVSFGPAIGPNGENIDGTFQLEPNNFTLTPDDPRGSMALRFIPRDCKLYEATIPLYLDGDRSQAYLTLEVVGQGQFPRLTFDVRECLLPPVPLGVPSRAVFNIINNGYDNLELKHRLPADEGRLPIKIEFPEGNLIGIAKERLPVVVHFLATRPVSFTANIDFMDEESKRFSIMVSGTTDNSLLSHFAFMAENSGSLGLDAKPGAPVLLETNGPAYKLPSPTDSLGPMATSPNLCRFLNATTPKGPFEAFTLVSQLVASRGNLPVELVVLLSGRGFPGKVGKLSHNKKEAAEQLVAMFDALLVHLKSHGALLNAVKPEMLLDLEDFGRVLNARTTRAAHDPEELLALEMWDEVEMRFDSVSRQAWNLLLLQVFKVFVMGRVTLKSFKSLPGIEALSEAGLVPPDSCITGSNLYSPAESVLLAWMTAHYQREYGPNMPRVTNFEEDLADGLVLFSLLAGYWPSLRAKKGNLKTTAGMPGRHQECIDNCEVVVRMMQDLALPFDVTAHELASPQPMEMAIFVLYLYQTLPQFVPRTTIEYNCRLGESVTKELELSNPSKKAISYNARLEGHKDFTIDSTLVRMEARSTIRLPIKCTPSTSIPQEARLVLMSRRDGGAHAATLVFLLKSSINTRAPLKRVRTEGPLYELQQFEFTVVNPFPNDGDFTISLLHEPAEPPPKKEPEQKRRGQVLVPKKKAEPEPAPDPAARPKPFPNAFGLDRNRLRLRVNGSDKLRASFLPFWMGTHHCTVVLKDKEQGEFVYEIVGEASLPAPILEAKAVVPLEGPTQYDLALPFVNSQLELAKRLFLEKHPLAKDKDQAALLKAEQLRVTDLDYTVSQTNSLMTCPAELALCANPPISGTPTPAGPPPQGAGGGGPGLGSKERPNLVDYFTQLAAQFQQPPQPNALRLTLKPIGTGIYPARLLLTSPLDTRVVDLELTCQTMTQQFTLDFVVPVRQSITQEIPLVNTGPSPMTVVAKLEGRAWTGQREVTVAAGSTLSYTLAFKPTVTGEHKGSLELSIPATGERNMYTLNGRGEEPVAEGHVIVECQARKGVTRTIAVPNIVGGPLEYKVLCDLDMVCGAETLKVGGTTSTSASYKVNILPQKTGNYIGSITFQAPDGQMVWYSLEVRASEPPEVGVIQVVSTVRKAVSITVNMANPQDHPLEFKVTYSDPALVGPSTVVLPVVSDPCPVNFFFAPLLPGDSLASIRLVNEELGEFWYKLQLHADPAPAEDLEEMVAEIGSRFSLPLSFDNPLDHPVTLFSESTNTRNFAVVPPEVVIPASDSATVQLVYTPSSLGQPEAGTVTINSEELGTWVYRARGRGEEPTVGEPTTLSAVLGQMTKGSLTWRNPFPSMVTVAVSLSTSSSSSSPDSPAASPHSLSSPAPSSSGEGPSPHSHSHPLSDLSLGQAIVLGQPAGGPPALGRSRSMANRAPEPGEEDEEQLHRVGGFGVLSIPVTFRPSTLRTSTAEVHVTVDDPPGVDSGVDPLVWRLPVRGVAEAPQGLNSIFRYRCKARAVVEETMEVVLTGLAQVGPEEEFQHEVVVPPEFRHDLDNALLITPVETRLRAPDQPLRYRVRFSPTRMFAAEAQFVVTKSSGGRWRFILDLQGTEPSTDGVLTLEAAMDQTARTPVLLYSSGRDPEPFTASFSPDTPLQFSVSPAKGMLPPAPVPGAPPPPAPLEVLYTCKDFGKVVSGQLFVVTADGTQFAYRLKGRMPTYQPPQPANFAKSIDNQLSPEVQQRLKAAQAAASKPNHLTKNIRRAKDLRL